jgi:hypothetical protein
MDIGANACIRRSLKNERPLANSPVTGQLSDHQHRHAQIVADLLHVNVLP